MKKATILSACECQAQLGAELDEHKHVLSGWAHDLRRKKRELAPAHAMEIERQRFDVAWLCPFCTRNTLRSFDTSALAFHEAPGHLGG
jgi:hypothetical protein